MSSSPSLPRPFSALRALALPLLAALVGASGTLHAQFAPGSGGSIPDIPPFVGNPGEFGGFRVDKTHRRNNLFGSGTRAEFDLRFPPPSEIEADGYRLQRRATPAHSWEDHPWGMDEYLETVSDDQDNFSFPPDGSFHYRLLALGGPRAGDVSNEAYAPFSSIDTRFAGWSLDEGMHISGVMLPWLGRGLEASFDVRELSEDENVEGGISLQWYRVNPATWEFTPIAGATAPVYITTDADVGGYYLLCRATGDGATVGGFQQIMSIGTVKIPNRAFASEHRPDGFRLNLFKSVPSLEPQDLTLSYWDDDAMQTVEIPIDSVTPVGGSASFRIAADLPAGQAEFQLSNSSEVWRLGEDFQGHYFMESLTVAAAPDISVQRPPGRELTSNRGRQNFGGVRVRRRTAARPFVVENLGIAPLASLRILTRGPQSGDFIVTNPGSRRLDPGQSTVFRARFRPSARGVRNARILVRSNAPRNDPFIIEVRGRGR